MTDIQVYKGYVCPTGYTDMFAQTFFGYTYGCDCTNRCCSDMTDCYKFMTDTSCTSN